MQTKNKVAIFILIMLGILFLTLATQEYFHSELNKFVQPSNFQLPAISMNGVIIVGRNKGKKEWEITAPSVTVSSNKKDAVYKGELRGTIFNEGEPFLIFSASFVKMQMKNRSFKAQNGVEIKRVDGNETFLTPEIEWDAPTGNFVAPGPIKVVSPNGLFMAKRLTGNTRTGKLMMEHVSFEAEP